MKWLFSVLLFLTCPLVTKAGSHNERKSHINGIPEGSARILLELTPGVVVYNDAGIKAEPTISAQAGFILPVWKMFALEGLAGYETATTMSFDTLLHGPVAASYFMTRLGLFSLGAGPTAGFDFKNATFEGAWLGLSTKFTVELGHNVEAGAQAGPRVFMTGEKTQWGADAYFVLALVI